MKKITKIIAVFLTLALTVGMLSACGGEGGGNQTTGAAESQSGGESQSTSTGDGPKYGGHLNVRVASLINGIDPLKKTGAWNYLFEMCVFEGALSRDADNEIVPGVCNFEMSDDKLTLKLTVVEGKTFSNGNAVTIQDVEASINRFLERYSNGTKKVKPFIESMTVDGDALTIKFNQYNTTCYRYLAAYQTWCPVMPKEICEKYAQNYIIDQCEDAIGTGPYVFSEFKNNVSITLTKRADYVPVETTYTGAAATKYGYMDSITFWANDSDESSALALLSGQYDIVEVIPAAYESMAEAQGLKAEKLTSNSTCFIIFNTMGSNLCSKYPALRKAIMASIDYEEFLSVVTDNQQLMNDNLLLSDQFANGVLTGTDYYGKTNQEAVEKYLAEAKAQGYDGEAIQYAFNSHTNTVATMVGNYLDNAGIQYQPNAMEANAYNTFINDNGNNWDFYFTWYNSNYYPTDLDTNILDKHYGNPEKDKLLDEMRLLPYDSPEYMAKWEDLSKIFADDCAFGFMSRIQWYWWCPQSFHPNDEDSVQRLMYNCYWDDPENHTRN
ncbi:MAG: ABC transporter substrate-binding protein [Lachnospiraceae bacterium]|nr:ABC transporter substrate-binding protein [Lachnospiraceae bacterium]